MDNIGVDSFLLKVKIRQIRKLDCLLFLKGENNPEAFKMSIALLWESSFNGGVWAYWSE